MKKTCLAGLLALALFISMTTAGTSYAKNKTGTVTITSSHMTLKMNMRMLWEDHISWTSAFIMASVAGLEDTGKIAERLLKNQEDIGNAIVPVYGQEAGAKLAALLKEHILIAADLVTAAKAGDNDKTAAAEKKWYANADDIAGFLAAANPHWLKKDLQAGLYAHLGLTKNEAVARITKDSAAYIEARDKGHAHILVLADVLTEGIVKQFPKKFMK
ncbi:MAG: glycosyltransferase [Smithellaceae bacterium]